MSIARHTAYNLAGSIVPILVSLATVPLYLVAVGLERFGVLSICWLLLGFFGLFDLGLGRAVSQRIASLASGSDEDRNEVFWTGLWISLGLAMLATIIMVPAASLAFSYMKFESAQVSAEVAAAVPWLAAAVPVALLSGVYTGALIGRERFGLVNVAEALATSLASIAPLALAWWVGPDLWILVAAALGARILSAAVLFVGCAKALPLLRPVKARRPMVKSLISYGGWVSASSLTAPLLAFWDRFAIGLMVGAGAVSVYVIPFTLVWRVAIIPAALSRALFPKFAARMEAGSGSLNIDSLHALSVVMTPVILLGIIGVRPFLDLWVGPELGAQCGRLAYILLPGIWINGFAHVLFSLLHAQGRPDLVGKMHIAQVLPYMAVLYFALLWLGVEGAALIWTVRAAVETAIMFRLAGVGLGQLTWLLPPALFVTAAALVALIVPPYSAGHWLALGFVLIAGTALSYNDRPEALRVLMRQIWRRSPRASGDR